MSLLVLFSAPEKRTDPAGRSPAKYIVTFKNFNFMKRETINKIANFILTVITAFVSTFLMQSCMNL
jgi:hypothetical protein